MIKRKNLAQLDDYFTPLSGRGGQWVYRCRLNGYTEQVAQFLQRYDQEARRNGCVIDGKLPNPTQDNLAYYQQMLGNDFQLSLGFITTQLKRWLPRMNTQQTTAIAGALYDMLDGLGKAGKTPAMVKNNYIKCMCWLYYRFESVLTHLGQDNLPKLLYVGSVSQYELPLLTILSDAGCDLVLVQPQGDEGYLKVDPTSQHSQALDIQGAFPPEFSLKNLRLVAQETQRRQSLLGKPSGFTLATNPWCTGKLLDDVATPPPSRGDDPKLIYNCFGRMSGVEDKVLYAQELYQFHQTLEGQKRHLVLVEGAMPPPTPEEIKSVVRGNYQGLEQMVGHLVQNIRCTVHPALQSMLHTAFVEVMLSQGTLPLQKLLNHGVYLLCWLNRYQKTLFPTWRPGEVSCFIRFGPCQGLSESLFLQFLAKLPVDVLVLCPNLGVACTLESPQLLTQQFPLSLAMEDFPKGGANVRMGTAAYHAEQELTEVLYTDSGLYRTQQYGKAESITLHTMYEEIALLWAEETNYRPNFQIAGDTVHVPVLFAKVSGVKDGKETEYWNAIQTLATAPQTYVVPHIPWIQSTDENPMKPFIHTFFARGHINKQAIKSHRAYPYGLLRPEMQDHILEKLQRLITAKTIQGTFENGTEYTIVSTALNLSQPLVRLLQAFDFTKVPPKILYIQTKEVAPSLEDAIMLAFLNLLGLDVGIFVPTGYQSVERYYTTPLLDEHPIGTFVYDLQVPDFTKRKQPSKWGLKFFGRGI